MVSEVKQLFSVPKGHYLLSHSVGCMPKSSSLVTSTFMQSWAESAGDAWPTWLSEVNRFKQALSILLNTKPEYICPQTNLSSGLSKYLLSKTVMSGKNKVLMHASAFPSLGFVVTCMQRYGYELKLIDNALPANDLEVWQSHMTSDVTIAIFTHVHSNTGVLSPIQDLCELAKQRSIDVVVDVAQSVGVIPIDLESWQADVVLGSCVKWLCGGPGAGFLWVCPHHCSKLQPTDSGWFSHENPFEFDIQQFRYAKGADRFWGGTPSILPFVIAANSVSLLLEIGGERIYQHNLALKKLLINVFQPYLDSEVKIDQLGGTLCLSFSSSNFDKIETVLKRQDVHYDHRNQTVRISGHIYNERDEMETFASLLQEELVQVN